MKYITYSTRWSHLKVRERETKKDLGPNEILVDVAYIGLNPIDVKLKSIALVPSDWKVGKDFSGVVAAVGSAQTSRWTVGERVCGGILAPMATLGSQAAIDVTVHAVLKTPSHMTDQEAASFPLTFGTAFSMLDKSTKKGKLLVLGGASNVGIYTIQIAKNMHKFHKIVATCSESSTALVQSAGADLTVDYTTGNLAEKLKQLDTKFDCIIDTVGGYDALSVWPQLLKPWTDGGSYVTSVGDIPPASSYKHALVGPTIKTLPWAAPRTIFGRLMGINYSIMLSKNSEWTQKAGEFLESFPLQVPIDSIHTLAGCQGAWDRLENLQAKGKVLICMTE